MKTNSRFHRVVAFAFAAVFAAVSAQGGTLYWKGATASAKAASNWCSDEALTTAAGAAPTTGDEVVLVAASGNMTWDLDGVALASWTQREGYAGTVTFKTGKRNGVAANTAPIYGWTDDDGETRILKITGDCVLLGGTWTSTAQPSIASGLAKTSGEGVYRLIAHVGGNLAVTNTTFSVDGQGFQNGQGPGSFDGHSGGFHAGMGGRFTNYDTKFNQGPCYGSFRSPVTIGTGGGGAGGPDRTGGGAIQLVVAGAFLPGETATFSAIAPRRDYYVGAGGSIFITAGSMVGGGSYSARGGIAGGYGGGGGGGRIAFHVTDAGADFSRFTGTYTTHAQGQSPAGFGGTTYFETAADGAGGGVLVVDGLTASTSSIWKYGTAVTAEDCAYEPKKLVLRDAAALGVMAGGTFKVKEVEVCDNLLVNARSQLRTLGGSFAFPADFTVPSNVTVHCWNSATLTVGDGTGTLTLAPGAGLKCDAASTLQGSLVFRSGATASHSQEWEIQTDVATLPRGQFDLKVTGDVTVEADAEIGARGLGYAANKGPGANSGNISGMHGGRVWNAAATKHCYGSITRPTAYGSGGGYAGSNGGGAIALTVLGNLRNDGTITADGGNCTYYSGAGGSVWVRAGTLTGAGVFSANGGISTSGEANGRPGSGGRVAVWLTGEGSDFEDFDNAGGRFEAFGGKVKGSTISASSGGGAGTVYKQTGAQEEHEGTLIIDNGGANTYLTEICAGGIGAQDVTDTEVGDVIIRNGGKLKVDTATLTVHGAWSNLTANAAAVGGTVAFVDASRPSLIGGTSEFSSLECVAPGKSIVFPPAAEGVTSVSAGGVLKLVGDAEHPVSLASLAEETEWFFTVGAGASCELRYLDVNRSNATNGILLVARDSAASAEKNNLNWEFPNIVPGATNEWTAAENRDWVNIANWSQGRLPVETDCVLVPGGVGAANGPVLSGLPVAVSNLIVESGASLDLGGVDLTVGGFTRVAGALTARGTETLRLCGDVDLTGATVASARSTVVLPGDGTWRVKTGGAVFWDVTAERSGGALAFPDGLTATHNLRLVATDAWMADFAATTVTCARANFIGTVGNVAALTLTGTDWTLDAKGDVGATGVRVDHSTAKRSAVYADAASVDNGNNVNWVFGAAACRWTGGSGNWSSASWSGGRPSVTSHVVIDTAVTVTVDVPAAAASLVVRGGGKLQVNKSLIVADALEVDDGSTVTVNTADPFVVTNNLVVRTGGKVTTASQKSLTLSVEGDALVEKDGLITALGLGYASSGESVGYAGTHAGRQLRTGRNSPFHAYGSIRRPITFGRGGSWADSAGGGAVRLTVAGELRVDGTVTADGYGSDYGSGAGGSVWITAGSLVGSGTISADGGTSPRSNENHQPGSGGRVAVWLTDPEAVFGDFEDRIHAWGGRTKGSTVAASYGSGAGTVYLKTGAQADNGGTLVIASDGSGNCAYDTEIAAGGLDGMTTDVTDTDVGTVIVKGGARLLVTNATLTVSGDWGPHERAPNLGGTVAFADASRTSHVYGSTTFSHFSCTEPGKRIEFDTSEGAVTRIREAGALTIVGAEGYSVVLRPMTEDVPWRIAVGDRSVPTLAHVDVALSDAREGMLLVATDSTVSELQGNQNWSFPAAVNPGEKITWTGEAGTSWADAKNWDRERIPCETDCVFVPNTANQPVLSGVMPEVNDLTIRTGAALHLNGNDITVTSNLCVAGEIVCSGAETVRVERNVDFTGGKLTAARSTLLLAGDGDQTVTRGTASLWNVTAAKGGGTVTFADDLKVDNFVAFSAMSAWTALFANGSTCSCRRFDANGLVNDAAALTLTGGSWSLSVSAYVGVKGVRVANSKATRCEAYASDSVDLGGNEGWHFDAPAMWTGASGNFSDKTKWSTGEVPCETNHVVIPAGKTVTVDVAANVKSMDVFGTVSATSPFSVRESLSVLDGGTLTHPANGSAETYKLDVTVGGDLYVADTAKITTLGKGYANSTGPSGAAGYTGTDNFYRAPSHGGRGDVYQGRGGATRCYGSIFRPRRIGAGGWSAGGGAVILKVGGTALIYGSIDAQGDAATHYAGAGGSVYLTCGTLAGWGTVQANCGNVTDSAQKYGGGGGRVAVWQTAARDWSGWAGLLSAYGSRSTADNALYGSAGTVYRQHAGQAEFCGEVIVDNAGGGWTYGTDLPPPVFSDDSKRALRQARVFLRNHAKLCIAADVKIEDITMESTGSQLNLEGHTLSIMSDAHRDRAGWQGTVTESGGTIVWPRGFVLIIR